MNRKIVSFLIILCFIILFATHGVPVIAADVRDNQIRDGQIRNNDIRNTEDIPQIHRENREVVTIQENQSIAQTVSDPRENENRPTEASGQVKKGVITESDIRTGGQNETESQTVNTETNKSPVQEQTQPNNNSQNGNAESNTITYVYYYYVYPEESGKGSALSSFDQNKATEERNAEEDFPVKTEKDKDKPKSWWWAAILLPAGAVIFLRRYYKRIIIWKFR